MFIQLLTGLDNNTEEKALRQALEGRDCLIRSINTFDAKYDHDYDYLNDGLSKLASATIIFSSYEWLSLANRPIDITRFPNLIVITQQYQNEFKDSYRPIIIILLSNNYITDVKTAIQTMDRQSTRYPEMSGSYKPTRYGWILRKPDEEPFALGAWQILKEYILPGYTFTTWSKYNTKADIPFNIKTMGIDFFEVESAVEERPITIERKHYYEIAKGWKAYQKGTFPDNYLENKTRYYLYILGILHWLEQDGKLRDIPDE